MSERIVTGLREPVLHDLDDLDRLFGEMSGIAGFRFSDEQRAAITAPLDTASVIIAGAGSGKTTVMAARVVWLVGHHGVAPERILGLTFTNKAAAELGLRIRRSLQALGERQTIGDGEPTTATYHAFAGTLIAEHGLNLGVEPDLRVVSDASRFQRAAMAVRTFERPLQHVGTHLPTLVGELLALDGQIAEHLTTPEAVREHARGLVALAEAQGNKPAVLRIAAETARKRAELTELVDQYRELKRVDGVMDFSDQMYFGAALAQDEHVGAALRDRFDVVLLDEYQDTSVAQRDLLKGLFAGLCVTAVGDPAQGIYGWRGAAANNLLEFLDDFPVPGRPGARLSLSETRRCPTGVIDLANSVVQPFYATTGEVTPLRSARSDAGRITVALHETVADEVAAVIEGVQRAHEAGTDLREIAILVRVGAENEAIVSALRAAGVPFEIVGLTGLLSQPEVADLLSVLEVLEDVTANPALLRLLDGPRWAIGPRDLALLGRRAAMLTRGAGRPDGSATLEDELARAVEGADPTEVVSLADAVDDPGDLGYSPEALERFRDLSGLLTYLRKHVGEPLVDLARRAMVALDLDLELESGDHPAAMDNVALLMDAIAAYAETDRFASLTGLLAYLRAEDEYNDGMEVSTPSEAESVKLLTAHKAKGLEWDVVFVPMMSATVFPSGKGRERWIGSAKTLPAELRGDHASVPDIEDWTPTAEREFKAAVKEDSLMEERRLAYVAFTRAKQELHVSGHWWGRTQAKPRGPSPFLEATRDWVVANGGEPSVWAGPPEDGAPNPHLDERVGLAWPAPGPRLERRRVLADAVRERLAAGDDAEPVEPEGRVAELADEVALLLAEAEQVEAGRNVVELPETLSATATMALHADPQRYAATLARPMPRRPSSAARYGTRFHAWVEARFDQQALLDPEDLPGQAESDIVDDADLEALMKAFAEGPYGERRPFAIEAPFSIVLGGQQVIGRIDAVYETTLDDGGPGFEVVDWKTNAAQTADPLQLAIYRLAWAELQGVDPSRVSAAFVYVRLGTTERPASLPGRAELERLLGWAD